MTPYDETSAELVREVINAGNALLIVFRAGRLPVNSLTRLEEKLDRLEEHWLEHGYHLTNEPSAKPGGPVFFAAKTSDSTWLFDLRQVTAAKLGPALNRERACIVHLLNGTQVTLPADEWPRLNRCLTGMERT